MSKKFEMEEDGLEMKVISETNLIELKKLAEFFKSFANMHKEEKDMYSEPFLRSLEKKRKKESILLTNLSSVYESYRKSIKNAGDLFTKVLNELVSPLEQFRQNQLKIYNENLLGIKDMIYDVYHYKDLVERTRFKYYKTSYDCLQNDLAKYELEKMKGESIDDSIDNIIRYRMIAKNNESIYKYEIERYNQKIKEVNKRYDTILKNAKLAEESRACFIKTSVFKYKNYIKEYISYMTNFLNELDVFCSEEVISKDTETIINELKKFKTKETGRIDEAKFIPFSDYYLDFYNGDLEPTLKINEVNKGKEDSKMDFESKLEYKESPENPKLIQMNEKEELDFMNQLIEDLKGINEPEIDKLPNSFELLRKGGELSEMRFLRCLLEKKQNKSLKFANLKNLEHLSNILNYISLYKGSILDKRFDLNFSITNLSDKIYYQNKINGNKVYLSAILSKNKYYRTQSFWRNIMELKLAMKILDILKNLKAMPLPETKKQGILGMIGNKIGLSNSTYKNSILGRSRIYPLVKDAYLKIPDTQIDFVDKIVSNEMFQVIKSSMQLCANFNFQSEKCLDLVALLTQDYKINKDNIRFFVTYFNVASFTIIKLLPNETENTVISLRLQKLNEKKKIVNIFGHTLKYLNYKDYGQLLLLNKYINKKLSKKIYKFTLATKNLDLKIRLNIWESILKVSEIKRKYNYKEVLKSANDEKTLTIIKKDVVRTRVGKVNYSEEVLEKIINVLYSVSQLNGDIKYCQGMNFIVQLLFEIYGEEEAFYIFLSLFLNTDYKLIFEKDLEKLKSFFYMFKKIISLLEPEISSCFNNSGVDIQYFMTPWFITLFTDTYRFHEKPNDNTEILLRILDNFILKGVKSTMQVSCSLLHFFETQLMEMKYEDMMQFFFNDVMKSEFFSKKYLDTFEQFFHNTKITTKLIKNIEDVYNQEIKLGEANKTKEE